jgi:hypothetical protein
MLASAGETLGDDGIPMRINVRLSKCEFAVLSEPLASFNWLLSSNLRLFSLPEMEGLCE